MAAFSGWVRAWTPGYMADERRLDRTCVPIAPRRTVGSVTVDAALYLPVPAGYQPTELTVGPWRSDAQHGGPPSALLGRLLEPLAEPDEFVARVSIELVRPVPLTTLTTTAERRQVSRRVAHGAAELISDGTVVAKASALYLRHSRLPEAGWTPDETTTLPGPEAFIPSPAWASGDGVAYHRDGAEHRFESGAFDEPGPARVWVRLRQPLVAGEETSPLCRVLAAADFGSGVSSIYGAEARAGLINADLTVSLHRALIGEWVGIDAVTRVSTDGVGLGLGRLFDENGTIGLSSQCLLGLLL